MAAPSKRITLILALTLLLALTLQSCARPTSDAAPTTSDTPAARDPAPVTDITQEPNTTPTPDTPQNTDPTPADPPEPPQDPAPIDPPPPEDPDTYPDPPAQDPDDTPPDPEPADSDLVDIDVYIPDIYIDLRYATENNFTGQTIYDFSTPQLRYGTVKKLMAAQKKLTAHGYSLKIWDAYRPRWAQYRLWEICPDPRFVSDPDKGSSHSRGNTLDVTLVYLDGGELPMPTDFDSFTSQADRDYSDVTDEQAYNARLLEDVMVECGFRPYSAEWWHFYDTESYPLIEE